MTAVKALTTTTCSMGAPKRAPPRIWLERFYRNSGAFHERQMLRHSAVWKQEMETLQACWGTDDVPSLEISTSPGEHTKYVEILHHYKVPPGWITNGPGHHIGD